MTVSGRFAEGQARFRARLRFSATPAILRRPPFCRIPGASVSGPKDFMRNLLSACGALALLLPTAVAQAPALEEARNSYASFAKVKETTKAELEELMKLRAQVERSSNCPHGRPTSIRLTIRELEKLFGRS